MRTGSYTGKVFPPKKSSNSGFSASQESLRTPRIAQGSGWHFWDVLSRAWSWNSPFQLGIFHNFCSKHKEKSADREVPDSLLQHIPQQTLLQVVLSLKTGRKRRNSNGKRQNSNGKRQNSNGKRQNSLERPFPQETAAESGINLTKKGHLCSIPKPFLILLPPPGEKNSDF